MKKPVLLLALAVTLVAPPLAAWNATGHQIVAGIAWDNMTPAARRNAIELLQSAPADACLVELLPIDARPREVREREFFMRASTWADLVRPNDDDVRPCTRYHRRDWHFINYFWEGTSGATECNVPLDRPDVVTPELNAVERLQMFRPVVACTSPRCGVSTGERAVTLAWILHLVGDIHQPLHTSARVTTSRGEHEGDQAVKSPDARRPRDDESRRLSRHAAPRADAERRVSAARVRRRDAGAGAGGIPAGGSAQSDLRVIAHHPSTRM
jgi:hypothetical protein